MPSELMRLAYARMRADNDWRVFYRHPFELSLVEVSVDDWLDEVQALTDAGAYVAEPAPPLEVPKPGWHIRPGLALSLRDQLAYHYATLKAAPAVTPPLDWSAYTVRFSYRVANSGKDWFEKEFQGWKNFDRVSLGKLSGGAKFVVVADISGYYENIDIGRLIAELSAAPVDPIVREQLRLLWNKWAGVRARGIPQACAPSHVFGEFFLDPVDRALRAYGIDHVRYLDDIRMFSSSAKRARLQLQELSRILRDRGLNLQTAKTEIFSASKAKIAFASVQRYLGRVSRRIAQELAALGDFNEYADPDEVRRFLATDPDNPPPEVVEKAWESFAEGALGGFDKTVFHYLLARLADLKSPAALDWSLDCVLQRPEETNHVLRHISSVLPKLTPTNLDRLALLLESKDVIYDYQRYLILRWFFEEGLSHPAVLRYARRNIGSGATPLLRPHAVAYLGAHGEPEDFIRLERSLREEVGALARATLLLALRREKGPLRNLWYGRCAGESPFVDRALQLARAPRGKARRH
jgi:hypothetical protein